MTTHVHGHIHGRRPRRRLAAVTAGAAALAPLTLMAPATAYAAPGDNGDVKIHSTTTAFGDQRNETKVCRFYLDAFNFDTVQLVSWSIDPQPGGSTGGHLAGSLTLVGGIGHTGPLALTNGHYKLTWTFVGETGAGKQKVFDVACVTPPPGTPSVPDVFGNPTPAGGADIGNLPAGGADTGVGTAAAGTDPVKAGFGVAIAGAALAGGVWFLRRGRRTDG